MSAERSNTGDVCVDTLLREEVSEEDAADAVLRCGKPGGGAERLGTSPDFPLGAERAANSALPSITVVRASASVDMGERRAPRDFGPAACCGDESSADISSSTSTIEADAKVVGFRRRSAVFGDDGVASERFERRRWLFGDAVCATEVAAACFGDEERRRLRLSLAEVEEAAMSFVAEERPSGVDRLRLVVASVDEVRLWVVGELTGELLSPFCISLE